MSKIYLKSSQNHLRLKRGCNKDALTLINHWGIDKKCWYKVLAPNLT